MRELLIQSDAADTTAKKIMKRRGPEKTNPAQAENKEEFVILTLKKKQPLQNPDTGRDVSPVTVYNLLKQTEPIRQKGKSMSEVHKAWKARKKLYTRQFGRKIKQMVDQAEKKWDALKAKDEGKKSQEAPGKEAPTKTKTEIPMDDKRKKALKRAQPSTRKHAYQWAKRLVAKDPSKKSVDAKKLMGDLLIQHEMIKKKHDVDDAAATLMQSDALKKALHKSTMKALHKRTTRNAGSLAQRVDAIADHVEAQGVKIQVKNEGLLEVPEGTDIMDLNAGHFVKLAGKRGWPAVSKALVNLVVWNKKQNPKLSKWADTMQEAVAAKIDEQRSEKKGAAVVEAGKWQWSKEFESEFGKPVFTLLESVGEVGEAVKWWHDMLNTSFYTVLRNKDLKNEFDEEFKERNIRKALDVINDIEDGLRLLNNLLE